MYKGILLSSAIVFENYYLNHLKHNNINTHSEYILNNKALFNNCVFRNITLLTNTPKQLCLYRSDGLAKGLAIILNIYGASAILKKKLKNP